MQVKKALFSSRAVDHTASSFFNITKRLIEERFVLDVDTTTRHLNIVGDVVNLVPIYWITEEIVRISSPHYHVTNNIREGGFIYQNPNQSRWENQRDGRV
jgi:hypothetical protein